MEMGGDTSQGLQTHRRRSLAHLTPKAALSLKSNRRANADFFPEEGVSTTKSALYSIGKDKNC
jgi:hypothetical protein